MNATQLESVRFATAVSPETLRAYENAATAIGRLDAAGVLAPPGLSRLLVLRASATAHGASRDGMIALLRPDGEGDKGLRAFHAALLAGAARARGGVVPSVALLHELLQVRRAGDPDAPPVDALLRDARERTPPVLKAVLAALALLGLSGDREERSRVAALAATLVLSVGGALTDAWVTLPLAREGTLAGPAVAGDAERDAWLLAAFTALAREARAAERGLAAARERIASDTSRVRDSLGRAAYSALDVLGLLGAEHILTVPDAARALGQTPPTSSAAVERLVALGIAREVTGRERSRAFVYVELVDALAPAPP